MRKVLLSSAVILFLGSCTLNQAQVKGVYTACLGYNSILQETDNALINGKITVVKAKTIEKILAPFESFCNGGQPTNSTVIINDIDNATLKASKELVNE